MTYGRMTVRRIACSYRCATMPHRFSDCSRVVEGNKHTRAPGGAVTKQLRRLCKGRGHDGGACRHGKQHSAAAGLLCAGVWTNENVGALREASVS